MPAKRLKRLDVTTSAAWRRWLAANHAAETEVWLVFHKQHTGHPSIAYLDALDEALCFGWIDSLVKRLDDDRYARKFTPRKAESRWSAISRARYAELEAAGRLAAPGRKRRPSDAPAEPAQAAAPRSARAQAPLEIPQYLLDGIAANAAAKQFFETLAPSHRRNYVQWIDSAKKEETKLRRLGEAIATMAVEEKLGLK